MLPDINTIEKLQRAIDARLRTVGQTRARFLRTRKIVERNLALLQTELQANDISAANWKHTIERLKLLLTTREFAAIEPLINEMLLNAYQERIEAFETARLNGNSKDEKKEKGNFSSLGAYLRKHIANPHPPRGGFARWWQFTKKAGGKVG